MSLADWTVKIVRGEWVPETRWFHRHVLRRRERYVERVLFAAPAPSNMRLVRSLNAPDAMYFQAPGLLPAGGVLHAE